MLRDKVHGQKPVAPPPPFPAPGKAAPWSEATKRILVPTANLPELTPTRGDNANGDNIAPLYERNFVSATGEFQLRWGGHFRKSNRRTDA